MNLVFIHSGEKVKEDTLGNLYTDGSYSMDIWNRYLAIADHITLVMRKDPMQYDPETAKKRFNMIDPEHIDYVEIPNQSASIKDYISLPLRRKKNQIIFESIQNSDSVIVRVPGTEKAVQYAKQLGKPCMAEVVGCPVDSLWNHGIKGKMLTLSAWYRLRKAMKAVPNAIYVTNEFLQKRYPTKGNSIGCSDVSVTHEEKTGYVGPIKARTGERKLILGTAAAIDVKYKGQQYVIRALRELREEGIESFVYQIAGNGDATYLKTLAKQNGVEDLVQFVGNIPRDQIDSWYKGLDIYIQPSLQEGLPRSVVEAMSHRVACIGSRAGGIPELLDAESLFPKRNVGKLCQLLVQFCDDNFRNKKAQRCYDRSLAYDINVLNEKRLAFMKQALIKGE